MANPPFSAVAVVGVGLIGESVALAVERRWPSVVVTRVDAGDPLDPLRGSDLVVLAAPIRANLQLLQRLPEYLSDGAVVTDVGSTKRVVVSAAGDLAPMTFIGGHPMAGAARGGAANARPDLFDGRSWILTPGRSTPADAMARLDAFVEGLGAIPHVMTPELHDRLVAAISQLPQMAASALMHVAGSLAGDAGLEIAGSGLADTTRLAASPPDIWRDIAATNEDALRDALDALIAALTQLRDGLGAGDAIDAVFTSACRWREALERARA